MTTATEPAGGAGPEIVLRWVGWHHPDGVALRAQQRVEIEARYGEDTEPGPKPNASDIAAFLLVYDTATWQAIGCGGLRKVTGQTGLDGLPAPGRNGEVFEIKRMYVRPDHRGRRIGQRILGELETLAARLGAAGLVLETGDRQPDAVRLYERAGYRRIPNFGHYVGFEASLCYGRPLEPADG